tara:strand:+ start:44 stop:322 length:279 start_codon:yes stop_codon:yes gene_type:complete
MTRPVTISIPLDDQDSQILTYTTKDHTKSVDPNSFQYTASIWDNTVVYSELINTQEVQKMAEQYPALQKAYKNFKQIYDLVKHDYIKNNKGK